MLEKENMSVEETQEAVAQATESQEHNDVSREEQEAEQRRRNDAEYNWAEMRRQMREKDQQIDELRSQFESISKRAPSQDEDDELARLAEDDILTVAQARKLAQKMAKNVAEEVIRSREVANLDERMQMKFSDYSDVVSKENMEILKKNDPELLETLVLMKDPYKQALAAYKLLKKFSGPQTVSAEKQKAMDNTRKPVSANAITNNSAIGNAHLFENGLTKEDKARIYREMQEAIKRA